MIALAIFPDGRRHALDGVGYAFARGGLVFRSAKPTYMHEAGTIAWVEVYDGPWRIVAPIEPTEVKVGNYFDFEFKVTLGAIQKEGS